jgi:DNA-binding beta-propeller fold protein YncE
MRWLGIILSAVALVPVTGGCTSSAPGRSARFEPVRFAMGEGPGRITVRGSLLRLLPNYRPVSGVESFLYGPDTGDPPLVRNPQGMTLLGQELLICDQGRSDVVAVDLVTGRARLWSDPNQPPRCPIDITASTDRVFVADTQSDRVIVYTAGGDYLRQLAGPRGAGKPAAVLAHSGVLYVGNVADGSIHRWDIAQQAWLDDLRGARDGPQVGAPTGFAITGDNALLVADALNAQVVRIPLDGGAWTRIGVPGRGPGQFVRPKQLAVTRGGLICVSDGGRQSVQVFDPAGEFLMELTARDGWRGLTLPYGLLSGIDLPTPAAGHGGEWMIVTDLLGDPTVLALAIEETP